MARKKENSVAALRESPDNIPPMMVAPEREVPGIIATHCAKPTIMACLMVISVASIVLGSIFRASTAKIINPPIISAHATTSGLNSTCLIKSTASTPMTTAGMKAKMTFMAKRRAC
ncbi:hypothetical protein D3C71_1654650 [compost metagenome]